MIVVQRFSTVVLLPPSHIIKLVHASHQNPVTEDSMYHDIVPRPHPNICIGIDTTSAKETIRVVLPVED